jgi:sulfur-oxidizing protein SoxY
MQTMQEDQQPAGASRRAVLTGAASAALIAVSPAARATMSEMDEAIAAFTRGAPIKQGGVKVDIPILLESGNSVPAVVSVESPMTPADHVVKLALFNEKNPLPQIAIFTFGPKSGRAWVSTRIRLSDSQKVVAVAQMSDGGFRMGMIEVIVTLPACAEER